MGIFKPEKIKKSPIRREKFDTVKYLTDKTLR